MCSWVIHGDAGINEVKVVLSGGGVVEVDVLCGRDGRTARTVKEAQRELNSKVVPIAY